VCGTVSSERSGHPDHCPLCHAHAARVRERVTSGAIWNALAEEHGARFPEAFRRRQIPADEVELRECLACGLGWFYPLVPGDTEFYSRLMGAIPYEESRWEFEVTAARLAPSEAVADFGCGTGAFLKSLAGLVRERAGVDHNEEATSGLRSAGIEGFAGPFADFAEAHREHFDVVCAFQVLEHVACVEELVKPMIRAVRPGGRVFIAVPNEDRWGRGSLEPLDWPPHHLSRWRLRNLAELATRFGLEVRALNVEPPPFSAVAEISRRPIERVFRQFPARGVQRLVLASWRRLLVGPRRYRWAAERGVFERYGVHGHSILAELQRPNRREAY
jgi:2-polyprenyl-3-methyl-5-hydroxy-6-metoxy-1,4-benzoquinol methylase